MRLILSTLSITLTFIFLEVTVRIFFDDGMNYEIEMMKYANQFKTISSNKKIGIEHRKNIAEKLMGANIILDDNGFRTFKNSKKNERKIIMLGDSMTFGWGANKPFPNLLNEQIQSYEVLNAGIGNTNTIMQINNFFENFSEKYDYDIIVLNFFINDFENIKIKEPNFFQKYSFLFTFLNNKINIVLIKLNIKKNWNNFYSESYLNKEIKNETLISIDRLNLYCQKNNIKLIIHNIPELRNLKNYKFYNETKIIKDYATIKNIKFIDSYEVLKKYPVDSLWVTELDPHANDIAHQIISDFLLSNLKKYLN